MFEHFTREDGAAITMFKGVRGHLTQADADVIKNLALNMEPGDIYVEIGSYLGCSACITGHFAPPCVLVYAHDIWVENMKSLGDETGPPVYTENYFKTFYENVRRLKLEHTIIPIRGDSKYTLTIHEPNSVSVAFVDGDHSYEGALSDMRNAWRLVKDGGTLIMHDCVRGSPVFDALETFSKENDLDADLVAFRGSSIVKVIKTAGDTDSKDGPDP